MKGPQGSKSYFSYFKQPVGNWVSAQDVVRWAKGKVKLFCIWAGSLWSHCGNTGCLIAVKTSDWPLMRSRAFLEWAFSFSFCCMSLINKNGITAEWLLVNCSLAGKILQNAGLAKGNNRRGSFVVKSLGTTLEPPPPSLPLNMHKSKGINRLPWSQSGVCLLCEKTQRETV